MTDRKKPPGGDYVVGYGKPPRHSQFMPGQSGNKGRSKKPPETQSEIVARVRDELVTINGRAMTKFELAVHATVNQTIKIGKPRDLQLLFELLDKHGAIAASDRAAEMKRGADTVMDRVMQVFYGTNNIDPADSAMIDQLEAEELQVIQKCPSCNETLRSRWKDPGYNDLVKRHGPTWLHGMVVEARKGPLSKD